MPISALGSGWCCSNPSLPWGGGFNTYGGETVAFSNVLDGDQWTSTLTRRSSGEVVTDNFALASKSFNQALFAIELPAQAPTPAGVAAVQRTTILRADTLSVD
ncbi:hypothetical protein MGN70_014774 [Eutypa lata]|nr:hypothetical protein MGN70_014774 [Eutypa lata]